MMEEFIIWICGTWEFPSKKEGIPYTQEELNLEWKKDGYRFLLPKKVYGIFKRQE